MLQGYRPIGELLFEKVIIQVFCFLFFFTDDWYNAPLQNRGGDGDDLRSSIKPGCNRMGSGGRIKMYPLYRNLQQNVVYPH